MTNTKGSKKKWIKIRIDFETGDIDVKNEVKPHDSGHTKEEELSPAQVNQLLQGPHKFIGQLIHTHSSPGCVTYILGGRAIKICY
jgi:hypothetical protein